LRLEEIEELRIRKVLGVDKAEDESGT